MNRALVFALAAASLARAEVALAGGSSCGGGGSSSSSDSSSSSSSDSGSDSSSSAPACTDEADIVGYRKCTKFGGWAHKRGAPLIMIELGTAVRSFTSPLGEATGELSHEDESFTYRVSGAPAGAGAPSSETAVVSTLRVGFGLPRGFYLAAETDLGGLTRTASHAEMTSTGTRGAPSITPGGSLLIDTLGVAGVRGETRRSSLGVEVAGGVRMLSYQYNSRYLACETTTSQQVTAPVLEARVRASMWLSPFLNVGASAGASVLDRGAWVGGLHLGFVSQAYGNLRD